MSKDICGENLQAAPAKDSRASPLNAVIDAMQYDNTRQEERDRARV